MSLLCAFTAGVAFCAWLELKKDVCIYAAAGMTMLAVHFWHEGD